MKLGTIMKKILITVAIVVAAAGAVVYGALTAPEQQEKQTSANTTSERQKLNDRLTTERPTVMLVLESAYPRVATDYIVSEGALYEDGQWFGTTLTHKGTDAANRDTLRVLMQKKNGIWILRTTPPEPLLSARKYTDVPKQVLQAINQPVSLPGTANSPTIN